MVWNLTVISGSHKAATQHLPFPNVTVEMLPNCYLLRYFLTFKMSANPAWKRRIISEIFSHIFQKPLLYFSCPNCYIFHYIHLTILGFLTLLTKEQQIIFGWKNILRNPTDMPINFKTKWYLAIPSLTLLMYYREWYILYLRTICSGIDVPIFCTTICGIYLPIYDKVAYTVPIYYAQCHVLYPCTTGSGTYDIYVLQIIYTVPIQAKCNIYVVNSW